MCSPAGLAVAGIGMQAFGQYQQGQAAKAAGYQNAAEMERQAREVRQQGVEQRNIMREEGAQGIESGKVGYAAGGVDLGSASVNIWERSSRQQLKADLETQERNVSRQSESLRRNAAYTRAGARAAGRAGGMGAAGTLLGGAGMVANNNPRWSW